MRESQRPGPGYSTTKSSPDIKDRLSVPVPKERLDELLLELILVDTVALVDPRRGPIAERIIERAMSPTDYSRVLDRYDEISEDDDDEAGLIEFCFKHATVKDSHWKSKMLRWFMRIVGSGRALSSDDVVELAGLAAAMGATCEWEALHRAGAR